jgi:hypothetical protein
MGSSVQVGLQCLNSEEIEVSTLSFQIIQRNRVNKWDAAMQVAVEVAQSMGWLLEQTRMILWEVCRCNHQASAVVDQDFQSKLVLNEKK